MAQLTLLHPITREARYLQESFTWAEWDRRFKPTNGTPYETYDEYTHTRAHRGYDMHDDYGAPVYAGVNGRTMYVYNGAALGLQIAVRDDLTGLYLVSNHLSWRTGNGQRVRPDTVVGHIGNSGGVPTHLHFTCYDENGYGWFHDPGPALESLREGLMPLNDADKKWINDTIDAAVREQVSRGVRAVMLGITDPTLLGSNTPPAWWNDAQPHNLKAIDSKVTK